MAKRKVTAATILGRITYTSIYVFLCFILAVLLLIVPADIVRQVLNHTFQRANVLVLAIAYVLTLIIVLFVYALRMYTSRTVLASIPKLWIPIEKGDVNKEVRAMIATSLGRSAAIAWEARPKVVSPPLQFDERLEIIVEGTTDTGVDDFGNKDEQEKDREHDTGRGGILKLCSGLRRRKQKNPPTTVEGQMGIALPPVRPVWGHVEHDGWESPGSPDLPNLQYATVLTELPNLIEAKAVSLAPLDLQSPSIDSPLALDPEAVALLQRTASMSMRDYVNHLVSLRMLPSADTDGPGEEQEGEQGQSLIATEFLDTYERARFSTRPMSKSLFRNLMHVFAELLRTMRPPDPAILYGGDEGNDGFEDGYSARSHSGDGVSMSESDGHIDDDAPRDGTPTTPTRSLNLSLSDSLLSHSVAHRGGDGNSVRSNTSSSHSQQRQRRQIRPPSSHHHQQQQQQYTRDRDRNSSANTWQQQQRYRTAPTTPMSRRFGGSGGGGNDNDRDAASSSHRSESSESMDTFARTRRPYPTTSSSSSSGQPSSSASASASVRSFSSGRSRATGLSKGSGSQNSVIIRLARPEDRDHARGLPYVLRMASDEH